MASEREKAKKPLRFGSIVKAKRATEWVRRGDIGVVIQLDEYDGESLIMWKNPHQVHDTDPPDSDFYRFLCVETAWFYQNSDCTVIGQAW